MKRTRLGKGVGSYRRPLEAWTYWYENGEWLVIAPSGARMSSHESETEAREESARRNAEEVA